MSDNCSIPDRIWHTCLIVLGLLGTLLLTCCSSNWPKEIDEYYYPIDQLKDGVVYVYETQTNGGNKVKSYWHFQSFLRDEGLIFSGQYYDSNFNMAQSFEQQIHPTGVLLNHYDLIIPVEDEKQTAPVEVIHKNVFPFIVMDTSTIYLYKIKFVNPQDSSINIITRNRRYLGSDLWSFEDNNYPAIRIGLLEQIINDLDGAITIDLKGYEVYASKIGMVYSERISLDGSTTIKERLIDLIPFEEFRKRLKD